MTDNAITDDELLAWLEASSGCQSEPFDDAMFEAAIDRVNQYLIFKKAFASMRAENIRLTKLLGEMA